MKTAVLAVVLCLAALSPEVASAGDPLLIHHAQGWRWDAQGRPQRFDAMAVDAQGRIVAVGREARVRRLAPDGARPVDMQGQVVLPGLIDAHGHTFSLGFARRSLSLRGTADLPAALRAIAAHAQTRPESSWLTGGGWNQANWQLGRFPSAQELDTVSSGKPAYLSRIDGHAAWANTRALQLAGITRDTPDPPGGRIERDAQGEPTGILIDGAMDLVGRLIPPTSREEMRAAFEAAQQELLALGLTAVHDAGISREADELLTQMDAAGELRLRLHGMLRGGDATLLADKLAAGPRDAQSGQRYALRAIKLFADGALGSRGAALRAPYSDASDTRGLLFFRDHALWETMRRAAARGFQINIHAIGDAANRQVLDGFEAVRREQGAKGMAPRHRIEHAQIVALEDIQRFARIGVIASIQPTHATSDMNMAEARVGPLRIRGGYAWQRLRAAGARLACGSDFPIESPNPWEGLYAAVTRQDEQGRPTGGWYGDQALTREQALRCFTRDAAYASGDEARWGSLAVGQQADFIVLGVDPLRAPPQAIRTTQVRQTWIGGTQVYSAR